MTESKRTGTKSPAKATKSTGTKTTKAAAAAAAAAEAAAQAEAGAVVQEAAPEVAAEVAPEVAPAAAAPAPVAAAEAKVTIEATSDAAPPLDPAATAIDTTVEAADEAAVLGPPPEGMFSLEQCVEFVLRAIVGNQEALTIVRKEEEDKVRISVAVAPEDLGKVIGKQGRTINALRAVVKTAAAHTNTQVVVDLEGKAV